MKRQVCGRAKTAREVRRDASPRIEGRKVKDILILSGKNILLPFRPAFRSSGIKKGSVTELSFRDGIRDTAAKQSFANMEGTKVAFDDMS